MLTDDNEPVPASGDGQEQVPLFPFPGGLFGGPPPMYDVLRDTCPLAVVRTPVGDQAVLVTRYDDVLQVMSDTRFSRDLRTPGAPRIFPGDLTSDPPRILTMDAPEHTRLRQLVQGPFTVRQAETWRPRVREIAEELLDGILTEGPPVDMVATYAYPLPVRVICQLFGVPEDDIERVREWSSALLSTTAMDLQQRVDRLAEFSQYLAAMISRPDDLPEGLIRHLVHVRVGDEQLTADELITLVRTVFAAGYETTAHVISRGIFTLLRHQDQYAELAADLTLLPGAVEEILRHQMLGAGALPRTAVEDVELISGTIRAGQGVFAPYVAANYDPRRFTEPERFDIHRSEAAHLHFGHGSHFCLGAGLARVELQEAFAAVLTRFPSPRLATAPEAIEWTDSYHLVGPRSLPVAW